MISFSGGITSSAFSKNLEAASQAKNSSMEKLSSGSRINRASDDAAGLSTSVKLSTRVSSQSVVERNIGEAIDKLSTADAYLDYAVEQVQLLREKTVLAMNWDNKWSSPSNPINADRGWDFENERRALYREFNRNEDRYLGDSPIVVQVGVDAGDKVSIDMTDLQLFEKFYDTGLYLKNWNSSNARQTLPVLDNLLDEIVTKKAEIGAFSNRLKSALSATNAEKIATNRGLSRIKDTDFSTETANLTKHQIKEQAALSVMAQAANMNESLCLSLIKSNS